MLHATAWPIFPASATQRGSALSVPHRRTMLAVTGRVIASGTPCPQAKAPPANSARWKSTRKLAQQAPQDWQGEAEACCVMVSASSEIDHDAMQVVAGGTVC